MTARQDSRGGGGTPAPRGEIFERGYRHYEGPREGRAHAIRALIVYSIKRGLGIKKRWTAKIIPFTLTAAAFVPVVIIIGVRALLGSAVDWFNYASLYAALSIVLLLFAAVAAPEMLCDDRHEHVLQLYFSRALTRVDYLVAKVSALGILMGAIALAPALLLFVGNTLLASGPLSYLAHHVGDLGRVVAIGTLFSVFYAALGLVVASYTERKGVAAAIYVGGMLVVSGIVGAIFSTVGGDWKRYLLLVDPTSLTEGLSNWVLGVQPEPDSVLAQAGLHGSWFLASVGALVVVCGVVMHRRYLAEE